MIAVLIAMTIGSAGPPSIFLDPEVVSAQPPCIFLTPPKVAPPVTPPVAKKVAPPKVAPPKAKPLTRIVIPPARQTGNYNGDLRSHLVTSHGFSASKIRYVSAAGLALLHSHAHEADRGSATSRHVIAIWR